MVWSDLISLLSTQGLHILGFDIDFRLHFIALNYTRPLVAKYDKEINYEDLKNNRLQENMITLGNMKSVLYVGLVLIVSAGVAFVAEVSSK